MIDEDRKKRNEGIEHFYRSHPESLVSRMPALDIYDYLEAFDAHKYGVSAAKKLDYQALTSPWEYDDRLLKDLGKKGKILFNTLPPVGAMGSDPRFLIFTAQLDSKNDVHAMVNALAIDSSEIDENAHVDIYIKVTVFCRDPQHFYDFLDKYKKYIKHSPKKDDTVGFVPGSGGGPVGFSG